ncbi:MAG: hypothetical protein IT383_15920 [Deltaproteobacteria bacterium]|nr:hypothetical protein [Deltaproteobacteria bacterium]
MTRARLITRPLVVVALACVAVALGCTKSVPIDLTVVEPANQTDQALNGATSFVLSSSGSVADDLVTFDPDVATPLAVGLTKDGEPGVVITLQAFASGGAGAPPQSIGRTMPLLLVDASQRASSMLLVGKLDTFGKTTSIGGGETTISPDAPVPGRHGHTATFVPVINKVLIAGGAVFVDGEERLLASADLYDPATGTFEALEGFDVARAYHAATAIPDDGRVLISGGFSIISGTLTTLATALIFDPTTKEFVTLQMAVPRAHHSSTLMEGAGLIALVGGCAGEGPNDGCTPTQAGAGNSGPSTQLAVTVETFDISQPTDAASTARVASGLLVPRAFHQATALGDDANTLLIVSGGADETDTVCDVEVFRASGGVLARLTETTGLEGFPDGKCPARHQAVAIDDNRLLVIGGQTQAQNGVPSGAGSPDCFFFSTTTGFEQSPSVQLLQGLGRTGHTAAVLAADEEGRNSMILVAGGTIGNGAPLAEVLEPEAGTGILKARVLAGPPAEALERAAMAILPTNQVMLTGGHTTSAPYTTRATAEIFFGP